MSFFHTVPVYRIGDTIEINPNHLGEFYPYYDKLFSIYGIPMTGFKNGRMLDDYVDKMFHITYIVPHPENGSPIYVVNKDGVTFLLKHDAIFRVSYHLDSQEDNTYTNLLYAAKKIGGYEKEFEYFNKKIKELEEELRKYKPNPMPELAAGMFGKVFYPEEDCFDYFVVTVSDRDLIMVYENGDFDNIDSFDEFGKGYIGDSISAEIAVLYTPWVKSFILAKTVDERHLDDSVFWRA